MVQNMYTSMVPFLAFLVIIRFPKSAISKFDGVRVDLTHIDAHRNLTKAEQISRSLERAALRSAKYCQRNHDVATPLYYYSGSEYIIDMKIGTPPQQISGIVDTGSHFIWTQCASCKHCAVQPTPKYDPSKSHSFTKLHTCMAPYDNCTYYFSYGGGTTETSGFIASETFILGSPIKIEKRLVLGCTTFFKFPDQQTDPLDNSTGIVGLGRGPYSLITQLGAKKFSFCANPDFTGTSPLFIGSSVKLDGGHVKSTPFNTSLVNDVHYHLNLRGISLGKKLLAIPPEAFIVDPSDNGGFIIDSGTTITSLVPIAYNAVIKAIKSVTKLPLAKSSARDLCFKVHPSSPPPMPNLTFHLQGADLVLPQENYMQFINNDETYCLAMESDAASILGNYQQHNIHFLYDLEKEILSFKPQKCDEL